jgi:hypothetical protein
MTPTTALTRAAALLLLTTIAHAAPPTTFPSTAPATAPAPRLGRFDPLPNNSCSVFISPDQRRWHIQTPTEAPIDINAVKTNIADQFAKPTPTLTDCSPALFEKSGAVWFITRDRRTLLRYDGTNWLERSPQNPPEIIGGFMGICPNHGMTLYRQHNLQTDDACFFIESTGISVYNGTDWSFLKFSSGAKRVFVDPFALLPERDNKGAVAIEFWKGTLSRYRDGKWKRLPLPTLGKEGVSGAAMAHDGNLWITTFIDRSSNIVIVPLDGTKPDPAAPPAPVKILDLDLSKHHPALSQDEAGTIYISLSGLPPKVAAEHNGLVVIPSNAPMRFIGSAYVNMNFSHPGLPADKGKSLWTSTSISSGEQWASRLDISNSPSTRHSMPAGFRFVQAIADDGTVYLSANNPLEPLARGRQYGSMVAYKPNESDTRAILRPQTFNTIDPALVAGDGTVWAQIPDKGICRFDGREWQPVFTPKAPNVTLIPANKDNMLWWIQPFNIKYDETFGLISGNKLLESKDLWTFVRENPEPFVTAVGINPRADLWTSTQQRIAFSGRTLDGGWSVAVDDQKRLWVTIDRELKILTEKNEWLDVKWPLGKTKKFRTEGNRGYAGNGPSLVIPIGDGAAMYVAGNSASHPKKAAVMSYDDGKFRSVEVPRATEKIWRAPDGALWVVYRQTPDGKNPDARIDKIALARIDATGVTKEHILPALPVLLDKSGILWLVGECDDRVRSGNFLLWKDGQILSTVQVPGLWKGDKITTDKPGSVYLWTNLGLHHLIAPPATPTQYTLKSTSLLEGDTTNAFNLYSSTITHCNQGLLITSTTTNREKRHTQHHLQFLSITD